MKTPRLTAFIGTAVLAVVALSGAAAPQGQQSAYRDPSGLLIVPVHDEVVPEALRDLYGMAATLSEENPDDFGTPILASGHVVLPAVTATSTALATATTPAAARRALDAYLASRASASAAQGAEASKALAPQMTDAERAEFVASVAVVPGGQSRADTYAISNAVFDLQFDARYQDAHIWQSEVDPLDGSVLLSVESLTPALAKSIVAAYGVATVHIRISPQPESWPDASRPHDTSPRYGGALIGAPTGSAPPGSRGRAARPT